MKSFFRIWLFLLLPTLMTCSHSQHFIELTNDRGKAKIIHSDKSPCFLIVIDSLKVDSSQYRLFSLKKDSTISVLANSYWRVNSVDSIRQTIGFQNCGRDTMTIALHKEQIRFLIPRGPSITISAHEAVDIVILPAFLIGTIGTAWGLISLPFPSTPWQEDLKLIRGGVIALGVFGLAMLIEELSQTDSTDNKYRIENLH